MDSLPDHIQFQLWLAEQESVETEMDDMDRRDLGRLKRLAKCKFILLAYFIVTNIWSHSKIQPRNVLRRYGSPRADTQDNSECG